jgi:hypothetical protein
MTKEAAPITLAPAGPPYIDPQLCQIQYAGQAFKIVFARLPKEFIADDLKRPEVWKKLQAKPNKALRKFDQVVCVAYDESWMAESTCCEARGETAVLAKPRITTFPDRYEPLFSDENYAVEFVGSGFAVRRKKDGVLMTQPIATAALAERDLRNLYPKRMGAA